MAKDERPKIARKVERVSNRLVSLLSGFVKEENEIDKRMMAIVDDIPIKAAEEGIKVLHLGGGLFSDYDQELYKQGVFLKKYQYEYLIPFVSESTGKERHFRCFLNVSKEWYREEYMGRPEMWGYMECDVSKSGDEDLASDLRSRGLEVRNDRGKWVVKDLGISDEEEAKID